MKKLIIYVLIIIFFVLTLTSCIPIFYFNTPVESSNIMYQIFVRSFYDSNGDGVGDLRGIAEKARYLKDLGIDIVWLMPINEAKSYHGYDPIDLYSIEQDYGNFNDFVFMVNKLHENGIRVVIDLVINHTSDQNPLFLDAIENTTNSKYWNWFILSLEDHSGQNHWHWKINSKGQKVWYFGLFDSSMPDFNYDCLEVREEIKKVIDFWFDRGVDGFRFDALKNIYGYDWDDGIAESSEYARELANYIYSKKSNAIIVAEVYTGDKNVLKSFSPMPVLNFSMMYTIRGNLEGKDWLISDGYIWYDDPFMRNYLFLDNHDLNRFISDLESFYEANGAQNPRFYAEAQFAIWNTLMVSLKGIPVIYYGNEIGQRGFKWSIYPNDLPVREPLQWYAAGEGHGQTFWTKSWYTDIEFGNAKNDGAMYDDPNDGVSVEEEFLDEHSLFNYLKTIFNLRKKYISLSKGDMKIKYESENLIVIERFANNQKVLVLINPDPFSVSYFEIPGGFRQIFYADLNNPSQGFVFEECDNNLSQNLDYTINPRQVYIFVSE
ncbi:MAG: alpha-amylase [Thermosipho sp. (in: Bacteria)]|nr:alpha-amylase [Thermosipho sp. (in: thermotogales)]